MSEDFVRKDIHEIEIRRLDERIDSAVLRMEARSETESTAFREHVLDELRSIRRDIANVESELKSEINTIRANAVDTSWNFALIVSAFCLIVSIVMTIIRVWK